MSNLHLLSQEDPHNVPSVTYNLDLSHSSSEINHGLREEYKWTRVDQETKQLMQKQRTVQMENEIIMLRQQN